MNKLSISHMSAVEVGPVEFVTIAAKAGCKHISAFVQQIPGQNSFPVINQDNLRAMRAQLQASDVQIGNVECFMITPKTEIELYRPGLELGVELGASSATVLLYDTDEQRVSDKLTQFCQLAASLGLRVGLEFLAMTPRWNTLTEAAQLISKIGQPNLGIGVDFLHMVRSGSSAAELAAIAPELIAYAQLCDGADLAVTQDYANEASLNRLAPGDGNFPIQDFLRALPPNTPLDIEVPQPQTRPTAERIRYIVEATKQQIQLADLL